MFTVNEAIKRYNLTPETTRVVVQGSGNVGGIGALLMHEAGYKVIAISDVGGGIHNANGIDIPDVLDLSCRKTNRSTDFRVPTRSGIRSCSRSSATSLPRVRPKTRSRRKTRNG